MSVKKGLDMGFNELKHRGKSYQLKQTHEMTCDGCSFSGRKLYDLGLENCPEGTDGILLCEKNGHAIWVEKITSDEQTETTSGKKFDDGKVDYTLIPPYALLAVANNLTAGLKKYKERDNWKKVPDAKNRYMKALYRHLEAIRRGEIYDPDALEPNTTHMSAVIANAMFLQEFHDNPELRSSVEQKSQSNILLDQVRDIVNDVRDSVYLSNSPYSDNEQIVNPYLDAILDEVDNLKGETK